MEERKPKLVVGTPIRRASGQLSSGCIMALLATGVLGFLGFLFVNSRDPEDKAAGYRILKVAEVTGDVAKSVCNC